MNSFDRSLEDTFRARKVWVIARDDIEYTGFVERIQWRDRHFILHGAENGEGEHVGAVLVSHAERVELVDEPLRVERIPIEEITASPYAVKQFDREANLEYIESIREEGVRRNFPVVRPIDDASDEYELVDGHKGIWACRCAGLDAQPCEIVELSDWEATEQFVYDHLPTARHVTKRRRTRERVSQNGGTTATFWTCAVYGAAVTLVVSLIVPLVSAIAGGGAAAYLREGDSGARIGATAGLIGSGLTIPLVGFLGAGMIAGGEAIGEPAGGAFLAAAVIGSALVAVALNVGFGALGGVLSARIA